MDSTNIVESTIFQVRNAPKSWRSCWLPSANKIETNNMEFPLEYGLSSMVCETFKGKHWLLGH